MDSQYYQNILYPLQDEVLRKINSADTKFYLSGGTAASRVYLQHRYSDDLDFFANDEPQFLLWVDRVIHALISSNEFLCQIILREERFVRLNIKKNKTELKMEFINDVPSRVGLVAEHAVLGRVDTAENILANKVTAIIDRRAPKDFSDIWGFCCQRHLSINEAMTNSQSKAAGIFPPDLARVLLDANEKDWQAIRWVNPPDLRKYLTSLHQLGNSLLLF